MARVAELAAAIPPKKINVSKVRLNILNAMRKLGRRIKRLLEKTVTSWEGEKPKFEVLVGLDRKGNATLVVGPVGSTKGVQKWAWLDEGTKKNYKIEAKNAPYLVFQRGYKAKTKVRTFASRPGGSFGKWARKKIVTHPGIDARLWSLTIERKFLREFDRIISEAAEVDFGK